jgi:hypothetical protein
MRTRVDEFVHFRIRRFNEPLFVSEKKIAASKFKNFDAKIISDKKLHKRALQTVIIQLKILTYRYRQHLLGPML